MTVDVEALARLAEAATPGPWREQGWDEEEQGYFVLGGGDPGTSAERMVAYTPVTNPYAASDAAFIAAASPEVVLALIAVQLRLAQALRVIRDSGGAYSTNVAAAALAECGIPDPPEEDHP